MYKENINNKNWHSFVKSHNLCNRVYDMLDFFNCFKDNDVEIAKKEIKKKMQNIYYVETLAKFFEEKKEKNKKNIELRCNLIDLITDLDFLKQYLTK